MLLLLLLSDSLAHASSLSPPLNLQTFVGGGGGKGRDLQPPFKSSLKLLRMKGVGPASASHASVPLSAYRRDPFLQTPVFAADLDPFRSSNDDIHSCSKPGF